ncbi:hypothetical protein AGMMS49975_23690 [Clostridia bacterium]|nr:hypothetical protein AGMMS49975_23690 [Clostridia bacterium]
MDNLKILIKRDGKEIACICRDNGVYSARILDDNSRYPISLFGIHKEKELAHKNIEDWLKRRVVPKEREDIGEILAAAGLSKYDYLELIKLNRGRITDDDFELEIAE